MLLKYMRRWVISGLLAHYHKQMAYTEWELTCVDELPQDMESRLLLLHSAHLQKVKALQAILQDLQTK